MTKVTLAERLDLTSAKPLARTLAAATGDVEVDAGSVTHLGGLCLQLLLAACQDCARTGRGFAILGSSSEFSAMLAQFGVAPDLLKSEATA